MKIAFVTPRYGPEVIGGAESAARMLAERLVGIGGCQVEVFTTCALDHITWDNYFPQETLDINGVTVHRFESLSGRQPEYFALDAALRKFPTTASLKDAEKWVELQGPVCPQLVDAVLSYGTHGAKSGAASSGGADITAFYPYLYYPITESISKIKGPSVLHPAAHDEPALYLPVFAKTFGSADGLVYHADAERELLQRVYPVAHLPQIVLGLGVDMPGSDTVYSDLLPGVLPKLSDRPYVMSLGRVDSHKGAVMAAEFFIAYKERHPGPLALVMVGPVTAELPAHPDIFLTGTVSEAVKWELLRNSLLLISPSAYESFSLVIMEAWSSGIPVMVNATCAVTKGHCASSEGGIWFDSYLTFEAGLSLLVNKADIRSALAANGRRYVQENYGWDVLVSRYIRFLERVIERANMR